MAFEPVQGLPESSLVNDDVRAKFAEDPEAMRLRLSEWLAEDVIAARLNGRPHNLSQSEIDFLVTVRPFTTVNELLPELSDEQVAWMAVNHPYTMLTERAARKRMLEHSPELFKQAVEASPKGALDMEYAVRRDGGRGYFSREETRALVVADPYHAFSDPAWRFLYSQGMLGSDEVAAVKATNPGALLQAPDLLPMTGFSGSTISQAIEADPAAGFRYAPEYVRRHIKLGELALRVPQEALRYGANLLDDETYEACFAAAAAQRGYQLTPEPKEQSRFKVNSRATTDSLSADRQRESASTVDLPV